MAEGVGAIIKGAKEINAELRLMDKRVDLATASAIKKVQGITKSSIKAKMRGRPRWDRRGKIKGATVGVNLNLSPHHMAKQGGPGQLTGALFRSIKASRKPRKELGGFSGAVFAGGKGGPQNLYKGKVEATAPYFKPGVESAKPKMPAVWHEAWLKATNK